MSALPPLRVVQLGRLRYGHALALQDRLVQARLADAIPDHLLLLDHPRVFTLSARGGAQHLLADPAELERRGIELCATDRGGDITYHGPGQLVGYLIARLHERERSVPRLFATLEEAVVRTLARHGLAARSGTRSGDGAQADLREAGVWIGNDKICALGLKLTHWVTKHGLALNVAPDLEDFGLIVACGLAHRGVTSMQRALGQAPPLDALGRELADELASGLGRSLQQAPASSLDSFARASV